MSDDGRLADLMRQGFMKPGKKGRKKKAEPEMVGCDLCQNWHREGQHKVKVPTKAQISALVESYAKMVLSAKLNAPLKVQQRFCIAYNKKRIALETSFPHIDFSSDQYNRNINEKAQGWRDAHPFFGSGKDW